ncbi:hypothetical protein [Flammeovirga kamogawensis]|uniref:Porin family protein n=1 Tax=Flammeovirga kamogawensis TaxID=373891 RepID=A0ABX8H4J2_9BACT|nr:hypothetical protein [Flammeovirga kamogawensis]MBB6461809.1 hypothetical protein [Flammeovirga kamogawensis]QWG10725.1 hypothetical protein KM029_25410 [Flammeovirga kamogawensis]TRX63827.1 hypothetical protein EO216_25780 [Flammeovirga kamogawensis]
MKKLYKSIAIAMLSIVSFTVTAQDTTPEIDNAKPTNLYTSVMAEGELSDNGAGMRFSIDKASADGRTMIVGELPVMYDNNTGKVNIENARLRVFHVVNKQYDKVMGTWGASVDVIAPGGTDDMWMISPGVLLGVMAWEKVQFFPIISYQYRSNFKGAVQHGMSFQVVTPIQINDKFFIRATPAIQLPDFRNSGTDLSFELGSYVTISKNLQWTTTVTTSQNYGNTVRTGISIFL